MTIESILRDLKGSIPELIERIRNKRRQRLLKREININADYRKTLQQLTLTELHEIRKTWDFTGISNLNKNELIEALVERILKNIDNWLKLLNEYHYTALITLVKNNGIVGMTEDKVNEGFLKVIEYYRNRGVIFTGSVKDVEGVILYMPPELVTVISARMAREDLKETIKANELIINVIKGLLFYYGTFPVFLLLDKVEELVEQEIDSKRFIDLLVAVVDYDPLLEQENSHLFLNLVKDRKWLLEEQQRRDELDYYPLELDEVCSAGKKEHQNWNNKQKIFKRCLQEAGLEEERANYFLEVMVNIIQNNKSVQQQLDFLQEEVNIEPTPSIINSLQKLNNFTHQWVLKGHTPYSLFQEEKLQELPAGGGNPYQPGREKGMVRKDVGRNDPCPCGSGKKYKKCCLPDHERKELLYNKLMEPWEIKWDYYSVDELIEKVAYPLLGIHYFMLEIINLAGHILHIYRVYGRYREIEEEELLEKVLERGLDFYDHCLNECKNDCLESPQGEVSFLPIMDKGLSIEDYPPSLQERKAINLFLLEILNILTAVIEDGLLASGIDEKKSREAAEAVYAGLIEFVSTNCRDDCTDKCVLELNESSYCRFCLNCEGRFPCPLEDEITLEEICVSREDLYHG